MKDNKNKNPKHSATGDSRRCSSTEDDGPLINECRVRIKAGTYDAICYRTETGNSWGGRQDIYIRFKIYGSKYDGTKLFMACTYPRGRMTTRHKYYEQWVLAMGGPPRKGERLARKEFLHKLYKVLVRDTNKKFSNGTRMPDYMQYSVVDTIIETQTGISRPC